MNQHPCYLNGQWVHAAPFLTVVNPATLETIGQMSTVGRGEIKQALADAESAWKGWRAMSARSRGACLNSIAGELERRGEEVARTITLENGKPLAQSKGEVAMAVDHLRWFAEEGRRAYGSVIPPQAEGKRHLVLKSPVGVVAAIAPWNFPLALAVRKVAPALAAGCPVILRPASATPLCAVALAQCVDAAGLPPGVFQLVAGPAQPIAAELLENPVCRKITFTGSTEVGKHLIRGSAQTVKRLSLELGGHAPVIVFDDADLERAVEGALIAKFRNTGQSCIAASRFYVQEAIYERFLEAFVERVRMLKIGNGLEEGVEIGPLINQGGLNLALEHIEEARRLGARVLCGAGRWKGGKGYFLEPTVLADVPEEAACMREETFAPVAPVTKFSDEADAIRRANALPYGLAAYVFTRDLGRAFRTMEGIEAGIIGINDPVPTTSNCPFGGFKQSGWGRELGHEGLEAFLETTHVSFGGI